MLTNTSVRIAKQAAQRFAGLDHVRLAYDATANTICLRPVTGKQHQANPSVYKLSQGERASLEIACASLSRVMPVGRYRFVKKWPTGFIFVRDGAPAGDQKGTGERGEN
jgi:hypothetical protein